MDSAIQVCDSCEVLEEKGEDRPCQTCATIIEKGGEPWCPVCVNRLVIGTAPPYEPPYALRELGNIYPEIEWLAHLPPADRAWHSQHLEHLIERYPTVPEWAWVKLLRKPNGSGRS